MKLNKELNIVGAIVFILLLISGAVNAGNINVGENIPAFIAMLIGGLGLLSQFVLLNISLAKK